MTSSTATGVLPAGPRARSTSTKAKSVPNQDTPKSTTRVQFDVSSKSMERLVALKEKIEANSYAEVVKNALRLYEALITEADNGSQFLVKSKDGNVTPFRMFV